MATLDEITATIAVDITRPDLTATIKEAVLAAIIDVEVNRLWFNETSGFTINTVVGQSDYDLTDPLNTTSTIVDFFQVDFIRSYSNGNWTSLGRRWSSEELDMDIAWNTLGGEPSGWGFYGGKFRFYPVPQTVTQIALAGHYKLAPLTAGDQTNSWLQKGRGYELIRSQAAARVLTRPIRNLQLAGAFSGIAGGELESLQNQTNKRKKTGRIRPLRGGF